jgi:hypothetical protein
MATIITRETGASAKNSPLTNAELDANFINLNTAKLEIADLVAGRNVDVITASGKTTVSTKGTSEFDSLTSTNIFSVNSNSDNSTLNAVNTAALHRSPNAVTAMFLYDTSKDSDGGAWTEKCQHTSWYNEALTGKWLGAAPNELSARAAGATLGAELSVNGGFDSDGGWTKDAAWTISGGVATVVGLPSQYPIIRQSYSYGAGKTISVTVVVTRYSSGRIAVISKIGRKQGEIVGVGTWTFNFVSASDDNVIGFQDDLGNGSYDIGSVSVREVTALNTSSNDYFQLSTDGKFYRLWKNLLPFSEQFDNAAWDKSNISVTANSTTAPDGTLSADKIIPSTNAVQHYVSSANIAAGTYTWSAYFKSAGYTKAAISCFDGTYKAATIYDLSNGTIVESANGSTSTITFVGNGWYRCTVTATLAAGNNFGGAQYRPNINGNDVSESVAGNGTDGVFLWGAQLELGSTATAYEAKGAGGSTSEVFRGNKRKFPKLAGIVAEAANVTIYDLTEPGRPMWMRFAVGGSWTYINGISLSGLFAVNGLLSATHTGNGGCLSLLAFASDTVRYFRQANNYSNAPRAINIASRQATTAPNAISETPPTLTNAVGNSVAMTVLPDAPFDPVTGLKVPTIAVATSSGVSVIQHTGIVNNIGTANNQRGVAFIGKMLVVEGVRGSSYAQWTADDVTKGTAAVITVRNPGRFDNNSSVPGYLSVGRSGSLASAMNKVGNYKIALSKINREASGNSVFAHITDTHNTGYMAGDIRRAYLADTDTGSVSGTELVVNGTFDADLSGWSYNATNWSWDASGAAKFSGDEGITSSSFLSIDASGDPVNTRYLVTARINVIAGQAAISFTYGSFLVRNLVSSGMRRYILVKTDSRQTAIGFCPENTNGFCEFTVDDVSIVKVFIDDRSYKSASASITGTLTKSQVASAAQLVAYSGFSASNYLREPYSADLDFGTGEWSVGAWVNVPVVMPVSPTTSSTELWSFVTPSISNSAGSTGGYNETTRTITNTTVGTNTSYPRFLFPVPSVIIGEHYLVAGQLTGDLVEGDPSVRLAISGGGSTLISVDTSTGVFSGVLKAESSSLEFVTDGTVAGWNITIASISIKRVVPFRLAERSFSSGASFALAVNYGGNLQAEVFDGTTTRTVTTTAAYNTATWLKAEAQYKTDGSLGIVVNGQEVAVTRGTPLLPLYGRKNLFNYSSTFSNNIWGVQNNGVKVSTTVSDPDGGNNAVEVAFNSQFASIAYGSSTCLNGQQYTLSFWARRDSGSNILSVFTNNGSPLATFSPTAVWVRYALTFTWTAGETFIIVAQDRNTTNRTNAQFYGMQLELGSSATTYVETGASPSDGHPLTIGNSFAADAPFPGSIALLKASATVPTAEQSVWMYEQEKQMFRDGAQVTLPDANAIVDLTYDDLTDKWIAVSATNESEWSGLVRTSVTPSPAGSYSKTVATSGVQMHARTTVNPGVDVTIPAYNMREELLKDAESASKVNSPVVVFDYAGGFTANTTINTTSIANVAGITYPVSYIGARITGTGIPTDTFILGVSGTTLYLSKPATATGTAVQIAFTDFILPVGFTAKMVSIAGSEKQEGSTKDWTRLYDGFKETIRMGVSPSNTAWVQIQAVKEI